MVCSREAEILVDTPVVIESVTSERKEASHHLLFNLFLAGLFTVSYYGRLDAHAAVQTNQMGYIIVIAWMPGIYGNLYPVAMLLCNMSSLRNINSAILISPGKESKSIAEDQRSSQCRTESIELCKNPSVERTGGRVTAEC